MTEKIIDLLGNIPEPLIVIILSMLPVGELRGSIPVGILEYHLSIPLVYFISVIGNLIPIVFVLLFLDKIDNWLRKKSKKVAACFDWLYKRTYKRGGKQFKKWGAVTLITFVAIPLPITGAWTGAVLALLFKVPFKKALSLIAIGVIISGVIVTILTITARGILNLPPI
ncbi:MAG: small multi-drug export protein [Patescibacteria group bacterium]|nr:small multi-drug export protein [Patescibacteria group bacterium]